MAEKINPVRKILERCFSNGVKTASPYILILVLVGLMIGFNLWTAWDNNFWNRYIRKAKAADIATTVTVANSAPVIRTISLGGTGLTTINLTEGSTVDIEASASIEDANGCTDVRDGGGVEAYVYSTEVLWTYGTGTSCSQDNNDCYTNDIVSCSWQSTTGNTCSYQCTASSAMYYYADPTLSNGGTASKAEEGWVVMVYASDSYWADVASYSWDVGSGTSNSAEVALLLALDASGTSASIDYDEGGSLNPGAESSTLERGVKNTGNRPMDPLIKETTTLTSGANTIAASHQQFDSATFTVDNGTSLSTSNQTLDLELPQQTDDTLASTSDDQLFWALYVPDGQSPGDYTGENTYTAAAD